MLDLYTVVRTADGRLAIYIGGWSGGERTTALAEVVYEDLAEATVPEAELRRAHIVLGYDCEGMRFKRGDPHWQDVLRRWFFKRGVDMAKQELQSAIERHEHPTCWAEMEGLVYALAYALDYRGRDVLNCAWRRLFDSDLPDNLDEFLEAYHADEDERYARYSEQVSGRMTAADLEVWLLKTYFDQWELREARNLLRSQGRKQAEKHLRDRAVESGRGQSSPYGPQWTTTGGHVHVWGPGKRSPHEPDLVMTCEALAKMALGPMSVQGTLF